MSCLFEVSTIYIGLNVFGFMVNCCLLMTPVFCFCAEAILALHLSYACFRGCIKHGTTC
jgi:hypothetical protein